MIVVFGSSSKVFIVDIGIFRWIDSQESIFSELFLQGISQIIFVFWLDILQLFQY